MKRLLALSLFAASAFAQQKTLTIAFTVPMPVLSDIVTHWMDMHGTSVATLAAPIGPAAVTITLGQQAAITVGSTLLIDDDVLPVVAFDGVSTVTVTRGVQGVPAKAHLVGAQVYVLTYPSVFALITAEALKPWMLGIVHGLSAQGRSAVIAATSGTLGIN